MSITYTYTVILVDEAARCMEIVYEAAGYQTMHISARLPYESETLEEIVRMYAPVPSWEAAVRIVIVPSVGATGVITPPVIPTPLQTQPTTTGTQTL